MSIARILFAISCLCVANAVNFSIRGKRGMHTAKSHTNALLPESWSNYRSSLKSTSSGTGYLISQIYLLSTTCTGEVSSNQATATGTCLVGLDADGNEMGSSILQFNSADADSIKYTSEVYESSDCTGTSVNTAAVVPVNCVTGGAPSTVGVKYYFSAEATPWTTYGKGFMFEYFDTQDSCDADTSDGFAWFSPDCCMETTLDDGSTGSLQFPSCNKKTFTMSEFTDKHCTEPLMNNTHIHFSCEAADDHDDVNHFNYQNTICANA